MAVMGCVVSFGAAPLQAQEESVIKHGEMNVSVMTMGAGEHVVIALHGAGGNDRRFFFGKNGGEMGQALAAAGFRVIAPSWAGQAGAGFNEVAAVVAHARETGATKISLTHFRTRDGVEMSSVSPLRYFCNQCHVPQSEAKPLIGNTFKPGAGLR